MSNEYQTRSARLKRNVSPQKVAPIEADSATAEIQDQQRAPLSKSRSNKQVSPHENRIAQRSSLPLWLYGLLGSLSVLLSLTFYTFPLWRMQATAIQSQNLYSGLAMQHGLVPYNDFFGTGGSIFYLINWLGNLGGSTWLLWIFGIIALLISGLLTYKLANQQTQNQTAATIVSAFTLVVIAGMARGGDAPTLFALPFALWGALFLNQYFREASTDRGFIRFGMAGAMTLVISPIMSVFFLMSMLALLIYNPLNRRFWRGFYQLLSALLGVLLVGYSVAYYALQEQTLYTSIEQSILIPLSQFGTASDLPIVLAKSLVMILIFGGVTGFIQGILQLKNSGSALIWHTLLLLGTVVVTILVVFNKNFDSSNLLAALPFMLVFTGLSIKDNDKILLKYLQNRLFAPILAILFVLLTPIVYSFQNRTIFAEEKAVVRYLTNHATSSDRVYAVAETKNINNLSRKVATIDNVPAHFPIKFSQAFDLKVGQLTDKYVVLEAGQKLPKSLSTVLSKEYKATTYSGQYFRIYEKK